MVQILASANRFGDTPDDASEEEAVCIRIRSAVSDGILPPGTKLPEELLADHWGIKRARIRTALQQLAFEGLVELKRNRGAFLSSPNAKEVRDLFEARRIIERTTTEIVTRTILTPQLNALQAQVAERDRGVMHGNRPRAIAGISHFHRSLAALAHNAFLATALERLILRTALILGRYGAPQLFAQTRGHFEIILGFVERGESMPAARAMERCLFDTEKGLDFRSAPPQEIDLVRILDRL
eukprot:gene25397-27533_t